MGKAIEAKLARGDVKEAFLVPQGLVWAVTETAACPCFHTMTMDRRWRSGWNYMPVVAPPRLHYQLMCHPPQSLMVKSYSGPTKSTNYSTLREKVGSHNDSITAAIEPNYWFKHFHYTSSSLVWCCGECWRVVAQCVSSNFVNNSKQFCTLFDGASKQRLLEEWAMDVSASPNMMAHLAWCFYFIYSIAQCKMSLT